MEALASAIVPIDQLIPEHQDVLRFRNLSTDEVRVFELTEIQDYSIF